MKLSHAIVALVAALGGWFAAVAFHSGPAPTTHPATAPGCQCPMHPWITGSQAGKCTICGMGLVAAQAGPGSAKAPPGCLMLPAGSPLVAGVTTALVRKEKLVRTLRVSGLIGEDESRHGVISAPVEGRIDGLAMTGHGDLITRRQPLLTIFSRTLLDEADSYRQALAKGGDELESAKTKLTRHGLVWEQIKAIPLRQPDDLHFGILAPLTGNVVRSYVSEGQYVKEGDKLFEIADFTRMWFTFTAYEQDLPHLHKGQIVSVTTPALPDRTIRARITFLNPNLDTATRSAQVRVVLENPDRKLRNNSTAEGIVELESPEVLAVPRGAILRPGNGAFAWVEQAPGVYERRAVTPGLCGDTVCEISEGLKEGERVVLGGNLLLDGQAQLGNFLPTTVPAAEPPMTPRDFHPQHKEAWLGFFQAVAALNEALAGDDLAAANTALAKIPVPPEALTHPPPGPGRDLKSLRQAFLPWSQETAALASAFKPHLTGLRVFRCPMTDELWTGAPANAGWVQLTPELHNPYWGKEMQACGEEDKK